MGRQRESMPDSVKYHLECFKCKATLGEKEGYVRCPHCKGSVQVLYDYERIKDRLNFATMRSASASVMKYFDFYPVRSVRSAVSLGEGGTPLLPCSVLSREFGFELSVKNEGANPTGSFKDRGSLVEIAKAREMGASAVTVASTGNMASSVSAYSSKAGIPCYVVVPDATPLSKLCQTMCFGSRMMQVKGSYDDAVRVSVELSEKYGFQLIGDYAFRAEGQKSQAFEIADQMDFEVPDYVAVPMGVGTNLAAIHKGFREFYDVGLTNSIPKMIGVQASGANAIVKAFSSNGEVRPVETNTIASAINVSYPYDGPKALAAIRESGGFALEVTDDEMLEAQQQLSKRESIFCEPSSATVIAALQKAAGRIKPGSSVVCVLTGNGLKDTDTALRGLAVPPSMEPSFREASKFIDNKLYNLKAPVRRVDKEKVVFSAQPDELELALKLSELFSVRLGKVELAEIGLLIGHFLRKDKHVTHSDLSAILQDVLSSLDSERVLKVEDYSVSASASGKAKSTVRITYMGKTLEQAGEGDGPVDATIAAVKKAIGNGTWFRLTDYKVNIDVGGTEATVMVIMAVADDRNNRATVRGASPDVVTASVRAFENAYNALYTKRKANGEGKG